MTLTARMDVKMDELELRMCTSSFWAGVVELGLRFAFHIEFFGYLGTGLILYSLFHYAQLRRAQYRREKNRR